MPPAHPNFTDFKYVSAALYTLAGSVTAFRLTLRLRKNHWWWDDTLALISMVFMGIFVAGAALLDQGATQPRRIQILAYYLIVIAYYITIWAARLSILFTVVRIAPWNRQRKILMYISGFFVFQWVFLMIQVFWVCEITNPQWKNKEGAICALGKAVPICQVLTTLMSDLILVISPLYILRQVSLNRALRFRLVSVFCISLATTAAALVHAVLVMIAPGAWEALFAAVEAAVALTVCNASVIIPFFGRKFSDSETFRDNGIDHTLRTIGGSKKKRDDSTKMSTLKIADMKTTTFQVEMSVDETHNASRSDASTLWWDKKEHVIGDEKSDGASASKADSLDIA